MFDQSFLPPADLAFVVMTDTHYMLDPGGQRVEFESRRRQAARAEHALGLIASIDAAFVVHCGDLVQEFPESPGFAESVGQALEQFKRAGVRQYQVAGNHDVGDKPDPTMPTDWATPESLRQYHERFGISWYSWDAAGCHFVVLNSQIMNGPLPEVAEQQRWLENDLAAHGSAPTFIFLHLAPFLADEGEQALGHYDNIDEPARSWFLDLVRTYHVKAVFCGHSHFSFFNRIGEASCRVVPSTAFTRPGFCEVFSSAPPPERGRDDAAKLGFLLVRVRGGQPSTHLIRTGGAVGLPDLAPGERRIITGTSRDLDRSQLGITLRHPLAQATEVPIAWQSTIRQPVRNDYPLLAAVELGARHIRTPAGDLEREAQRGRLEVLRDEEVSISPYWIWSERSTLLDQAQRHRRLIDTVEIQLPGALMPPPDAMAAVAQCRREMSLCVRLAPLLPREVVAGKQHARTRVGYRPDELDPVDAALDAGDALVDRVLCRIGADENPWDAITSCSQRDFRRIGNLDWAMELGETDERAQVARVAEALFATGTDRDARLYIEPLVDLDRTMDAPLGLLDRLCNPRAQFHAARVLNTVLYGSGPEWAAADSPELYGARTRVLESAAARAVLVLPERDVAEARVSLADAGTSVSTPCRLIRLAAGTILSLDQAHDEVPITEPSVLLFDLEEIQA